MDTKLKFISLFAGIGGFDLGLERAGMECVAQVEIEDYPTRVLEKHWPDVPRFRDVRDVGKHNLPTANAICGGFPCQDVSLAGARAGLDGERSTLWSEFFRIVCEISPRWVIIENVTGLFSANNGEFFSKILRELSQIGYDAEWRVIPAAALGAPQIRERVFIVAYPNSQLGTLEVFDRHGKKSFGWHPSPAKWCQVRNIPEVGYTTDRRVSEYTEGLSFPCVPLLAHGFPDELGAIKGLGNAVVPQVAEFVGRAIMDVERQLVNGEG